MSEISIKSAVQVLVVNAGKDDAKALFVVTLSDGRKAMFARLSEADQNLYFQNRAAITAIDGIGSDVPAMFLDVFPIDIKVTVSSVGALPAEWMYLGSNASFAPNRSGTVSFNGFDPSKGLYSDGKGGFSSEPIKTTTAATTVAGNTVVTPPATTSFINKPWVKVAGWVALGLGLITGIVLAFRGGKKKR